MTTLQQAIDLLVEARKIIRASDRRNLVKDWDSRATAAIAQGRGRVLTDQECGAIAYELAKRLVIDMPTARSVVDAAIGHMKKGQL